MIKPSRRLTQRECLIGYVVILTATFAIVKTWILPGLRSIEDGHKKISFLQTQIATSKAALDVLQQRSVASIPDGPALAMKDYVHTSSHLAQALENLVADDPHLITRLIRFDHAEQAKDHKIVDFQLEIVGSFPAIGSFIERLESSHLLAQVVSLDVARVGTDLDRCVAKIGVTTHLFLPEHGND